MYVVDKCRIADALALRKRKMSTNKYQLRKVTDIKLDESLEKMLSRFSFTVTKCYLNNKILPFNIKKN